jgi:hypothetical protein
LEVGARIDGSRKVRRQLGRLYPVMSPDREIIK